MESVFGKQKATQRYLWVALLLYFLKILKIYRLRVSHQARALGLKINRGFPCCNWKGNLESNNNIKTMPKHYANKRLTRLDSIFDEINTEDDDTTTNNGKEGRPKRESTDNDSSATQAK